MRWIAIALVCLYLAWVGYVEYLNYVVWDTAMYFAQRAATGVLPTPVADASVAPLTGPRVERFGLLVQMPGDIIAVEHEPETVSLTGLINGGSVIFFPFKFDEAAMMRNATPAQARALRTALGSQPIQSNYDLLAAVVEETPEAVKWWGGRVRNTRGMILLRNKAMAVGDADAIHPVHGGAVRGFQFGDPADAPYVVSFDLFDAQDRHYRMVISGKRQGMPVITQPQINAMIGSIKTTP